MDLVRLVLFVFTVQSSSLCGIKKKVEDCRDDAVKYIGILKDSIRSFSYNVLERISDKCTKAGVCKNKSYWTCANELRKTTSTFVKTKLGLLKKSIKDVASYKKPTYNESDKLAKGPEEDEVAEKPFDGDHAFGDEFDGSNMPDGMDLEAILKNLIDQLNKMGEGVEQDLNADDEERVEDKEPRKTEVSQDVDADL